MAGSGFVNGFVTGAMWNVGVAFVLGIAFGAIAGQSLRTSVNFNG